MLEPPLSDGEQLVHVRRSHHHTPHSVAEDISWRNQSSWSANMVLPTPYSKRSRVKVPRARWDGCGAQAQSLLGFSVRHV
jgi:hypothetical protein